jgi:predicted NBD/HSP70 family sugar kinase
MSWTAITSAEVLQEWNTKEPLAIKAQQAAADNLPAILARVVNKVRDSVLAGGGRVDQAGTIPDQLREEVIAIARWNLLLSLPEVSEPLLGKARRSAYDDAMKRIDLVSKGEIKIAVPANPLSVSAPGHAVSVPRAGRDVKPCGFDKMGSS